MDDRLVVNTGPLVALARGDALGLLDSLPYRLLIPEEVVAELVAGEAAGLPPIGLARLEVHGLAHPLAALATVALDRGESAVLQLALDLGISTVVLDERKARRVALALGLRVTGTLGLLSRAKALGKLARIAPVVERMRAGGVFFDPRLVARVLAGNGEQ